jgi:hypothetical protein
MNAEHQLQLLDVVALVVDRPENGLFRGQVGTIVEDLGAGHYEVEFSDDQGHTYASVAASAGELLALHYKERRAA